MKESKTLAELKRISESPLFNADVSSWISEGKKVIGWLCTYIPEEIIYAAGILPLRVMGSDEAKLGESEAYLYSNTCSYARCCFELGLNGNYSFLSGLVAGTTCDHIRRLYEVWQEYLDIPFTCLLSIPHKITDKSCRFFKLEVCKFKEKLENFIGSEITEQSLNQAVITYNKTRILLKRLYDLRKSESPMISGAEIQDVLTAGPRIPRDKYNTLLNMLLEEINNRDECYKGKVRLMLSGAVLDTSNFIMEIENQGGLVVVDELCTGSSYFWDLVDTRQKPLDALAKRYLQRAPCARMRPSSARYEHITKLAEDYHVDGVISLKIKFCDLYGYDSLLFKKRLERNGIPVLELEREYKDCGSGQMRTRVQAFIEMLEG